MELWKLLEEIRRLMFARNIIAPAESLIDIVETAWQNLEEAEG